MWIGAERRLVAEAVKRNVVTRAPCTGSSRLS